MRLLKRKTPVTDWSWTCPDEKSCWDKFHEFYLPNKLFNTYFYINNAENMCKFAGYVYSSTLYQKNMQH